jgi:hypothetical protein
MDQTYWTQERDWKNNCREWFWNGMWRNEERFIYRERGGVE